MKTIPFSRLYFLALCPLLIMVVSILFKAADPRLVALPLLLLLVLAGRDLLQFVGKKGLLLVVASVFVLSTGLLTVFSEYRFYMFGWHNMMQLDSMYSWVLGGVDLYYYRDGLSYPYFGLLPLTQISRLANVSPLTLYLWFNILCFIVWFAAYVNNLKKKVNADHSITATCITFLISGLFVLLYAYISPRVNGLLNNYIQNFALPYCESRVSPMFSKFFGIDAMTIGIPSLAIQYFFSLCRTRQSLVMSFLFGVQTILSYPLLGPVSLLIPLSVIIFSKGNRIPEFGTFIVLTFILYFSLKNVSGDQISTGLLFVTNPIQIISRVVSAVIVCAPFLILISFKVMRDGTLSAHLDLLFIFLLSAGAFCLVDLPMGVQYKFLYGSMVIMGFSASEEIAYLIGRLNSRRIYFVYVVIFLGFLACYKQHLSMHVPPDKSIIPIISDNSFWVQTPESIAIRGILSDKGLASARGVMITDTDYPASVMLRIPEYFNLNDSENLGYQMKYSKINIEVRRLDPLLFNNRKILSQKILAGGDVQAAKSLKSQLNADFLLLISDKILSGSQYATNKVMRSNKKVGVSAQPLYVCVFQ
jgi:hypothetical protein